MNVVETMGLTKHFGSKAALDGLHLEIPAGSVFGFLGPNGAGKTTALRILLGLALPTAGTAKVLGRPAGQSNERIGYLPDVPAFYDWMTAREFMQLSGGLCAVPQNTLKARVPELLDMVGLGASNAKLGGYSRGMKQRLGIAQALINDPEVVFLDEPTSALDPIGRKDVLECIAALSGRTVVFSTHILADVERICDRVAILDRGRVIASETVADLRGRYGEHSLIAEVSDGELLERAMSGASWASVSRRDGNVLYLTVMSSTAAETAFPRLCADLGLGLRRLERSESTLEDIFVKLVGGDTP